MSRGGAIPRTLYRLRVFADDGRCFRTRLYWTYPAVMRQAAYWHHRGCRVHVDRSAAPVEWHHQFSVGMP